MMKTEERIKPEKTRAQPPFREYSKDYKPMGQYALYAALYVGAVTAGLIVAERQRKLPERFSPEDLLLLGVATHKMTRLVAKDWVTSPFRAPFTEFEETDGAGEVSESPRGMGMRQATGALITCQWCLGPWVAGAFAFGMTIAPRATRLVGSILGLVTISDFLHHVYNKTKILSE